MVPIRNCTTETSLERGDHEMGNSELIQATTKKIVELIKDLIEHANSNNMKNVVSTSNKIYHTTQDMATSLLLKVLLLNF